MGHHLCVALCGADFRVVASGRGPARTPIHHPNLCYCNLDFTDPTAVKDAFALYKPSVVVHSGALSKPDDCERDKETADRINVAGTVHLLREAAACKAHFIFLSTDFVFSGREGSYKEDDPRAPVNYYGLTKLRAEDEVMRYPYPWTIARTVLVYGPSVGRHNLVTLTAATLKDGKPLRIFNDQVRTPTYVGDLVDGLVAVIKQGATGIYHLSGEDVKTPYDVATETAQHLKLNANLITAITAADLKEPAQRPARTGFDIGKAKRELGFKPVSFAEGLHKTFDS